MGEGLRPSPTSLRSKLPGPKARHRAIQNAACTTTWPAKRAILLYKSHFEWPCTTSCDSSCLLLKAAADHLKCDSKLESRSDSCLDSHFKWAVPRRVPSKCVRLQQQISARSALFCCSNRSHFEHACRRQATQKKESEASASDSSENRLKKYRRSRYFFNLFSLESLAPDPKSY